MINVVPSTPYFALASQVYSTATNMLDINWAPIVGALIVTKKAWDEMSPAGQQALRAAGEKAGVQMRLKARQEVDEAVAAMKKRGLAVNKPSPEQWREWDRAGRQALPAHPRHDGAGRDLRRSLPAPEGLPRRQGQMTGRLARLDQGPAVLALALMVLLPPAGDALRPLMGQGIENAPVLVQHLGLVLAMSGAIAAERRGHLSSLGSSLDHLGGAAMQARVRAFAKGGSALVCGMLAHSGWALVAAESQSAQLLAYGIPTWWVQLSCRSASRCWACGSARG